MSCSSVHHEKFLLPLEEINRATQNFSSETLIADDRCSVYRGQLSERWQNRKAAIKCFSPKDDQRQKEFENELELLSSFNHENIIPFIGYCDEGDERIIVTEYATKGSLSNYINDLDEDSALTWKQYLKICLGAAKGINYLHSRVSKDYIVVQKSVSSSNILLDNDLEAKMCGFSLSRSISRNQQQVFEPDNENITSYRNPKHYVDPVYRENGMVMTKTDTYSFGVVLFELLTGKLANMSIEDIYEESVS